MRLLYLMLITTMFSSLLLAEETVVHKKLPLQQSLPLLKSIEPSALKMGSGETKVYVFVDPLCPHSRNFVEMIAESDKMRSKYSYYFFLYTLKRMHSEAIVATIYASNNPVATMLNVMVNKKSVKAVKEGSQTAYKKIKSVEQVAKRLDVYKRPYMIMVKKPKIKRGN